MTKIANTTHLRAASSESKRMERRFKAIEKKVHTIAAAMNLPEPKKIQVVSKHSFSLLPSYSESKMQIPLHFLVRPRDLPRQFRLKKFDDPRLNSKKFLKKADKWLHHFLNQKKQLPIPRENLKLLLRYLREPHHVNKSQDFLIGHQLAHLKLKHSEKNMSEFKKHLKTVSIATLVTIAVSSVFLGLVLPQLLLPGLLLISTISLTLCISEQFFTARKLSTKQEKAASLKAVEVTHTAQNKHYITQTLKRQAQAQRKASVLARLQWNLKGKPRFATLLHQEGI